MRRRKAFYLEDDRRARIIAAIGGRGGLNPATYLEQVCASAANILRVDGAGITLMTRTQWGAVWASSESAQALQDLQFALGEGPGLDAFHLGKPALRPRLADNSARWPFFTPPALKLGARAVFAFPLQVGAIRLGALNLFRDAPGFLSDDELADALLLADLVTHDIIDLQSQGGLHPSLSDQSGFRARIHQATGMVSAQYDSDMAGALARLRAYAFATEISIFDVAQQVIERRLRL